MKSISLVFLAGCLIGYSFWHARVWLSDDIPVQMATLPDSSEYFGPLVDGLMQGHGRLHWRNGDYYIGEFHQGLLHGQGRLQLSLIHI